MSKLLKKLVVDKLKKGHVGRPRKVIGCNFFLFTTSNKNISKGLIRSKRFKRNVERWQG
jgi:hypothetical protein